MKFRSASVLGMFLVSTGLVAAACSGSESPAPKDGADASATGTPTGTQTTPTATQTGTTPITPPGNTYCCIKGSFYECGTEGMAQACTGSQNPSFCTADAQQNAKCGGTSGANIGETCSASVKCGGSMICVYYGTASNGVCTHTCANINDCQDYPGWPQGSCGPVKNASANYCLPKL